MNPRLNKQPQGLNLLLLSIGLISAAALTYEILLMRLLSIIQWHHFAYMIISLALLGYGASGTFLTLIKDRLKYQFGDLYVANAILFAIATIGCFSVAQHVPFNGLELIWNPRQISWLTVLYLLLTLPFFFAANCFGAAFLHFHEHIPRIYRWDLVGAGVGALAIIALLFILSPEHCLKLIACAGLVGAALVVMAGSGVRLQHYWTMMLVFILGLLLLWPTNWTQLKMSQFKGLPNTLQVIGTKVVSEHSSPLGLLTVVESPEIPFRHAPGLSLASQTEPPPQLGVFTDGDGMSVINRVEGSSENLAYLADLSSALPYQLLKAPQVLVLGAGGGSDVLQALYHQASAVDAVELNPQMIELVRDTYSNFSGQIYRHPHVNVHIADARDYLSSNDVHYDLIQVALVDSYAASGTGTHALSESYLYTVEALQQYYQHLKKGGVLAITRWLKLPPRDSLKLFATSITALHQLGITQPSAQLALIRSWQTCTLLLKKGHFNQADIDAIRTFSEARSFDVSYYPGIKPHEVNRFNVLDQAYLYEGATALLGHDRNNYLANYKFNLQPATDDQPYFFHFFKWRLIPELFTLREQGGLVLLDAGYLILTATLAQAIPISVVLTLAPLLIITRLRNYPNQGWRPAIYFLCLGFAFLFMEIAFIQRLILFVSHPLYATVVVLSGFLVFAGLGSGYSARLSLKERSWSPVDLAVMGIALTAFLHLWVIPTLLSLAIALPIAVKVFIALIVIAPLAFFMGMPFPLGMTRLAHRAPEFVPWAWGINGCASVLSAILATLIAIHFGFHTVIVLSVMLYIIATWVWR